MRLLLWASIAVAQLGTVTANNPCSVAAVPNGANPECGVLVHGSECVPTCDEGYVLSDTAKCNNGVYTPFTCDTDFVDGYQKMSSDGACQRNGKDLDFIISQDVLNVQECAVACTHVNECAGFSISVQGYKLQGCQLQVPGKDLTYANINDWFLDKLNPQHDVSFTQWTQVTSNDASNADSGPIDGTDDAGGWKCYKKNSYPNCVASKPMCCEAQENACWQPSFDTFKCSTASECVGCLGIVDISDLEYLACPAAAANDAPSPPAAAPSPPTAGGAINGVVNSENNTKASSGMSDEALVAILIALGATAAGAGGYTVYKKKDIVKKLITDAYKNFFLKTKPARGMTVNLM